MEELSEDLSFEDDVTDSEMVFAYEQVHECELPSVHSTGGYSFDTTITDEEFVQAGKSVEALLLKTSWYVLITLKTHRDPLESIEALAV